MVRQNAMKILDLIKRNDGINREKMSNPDIEIQKIIDIILSECRCSIIDENGNYMRYGSSTDIRIIRHLIQIFISNLKEIPAEVVSMALTKEGVLGPFKKIEFTKKYNDENELYNIEMEKIFPNEFYVSIFEENLEVREKFIKQVIKPYVKEIIFQNDKLMEKSPIGSRINKYIVQKFTTSKTDEEITKELNEILKSALNTEECLIENISDYIFINIMNNKFFKEELISRTLEDTELQKLGKISVGFNSLVESMVFETLQMIKLRNFPYGEIMSIKDTFYTVTAVLGTLTTTFSGMNEAELVKAIEGVNRKFIRKESATYRTSKTSPNSNKYTNMDKLVDVENIQLALKNVCKMIKVLVDRKENMETFTYVKEVLRIHYRLLRIQPFEQANGRTARAVVNILLQEKGLLGIFRKEKRKEYVDYINEANRVVKKEEARYLEALSGNALECVGLEDMFLDGELPFLVVKG